jgi:glyoxylase-like metal-dependent hydrolase (beta-lactamase superfamily II)
VLEVGDRVHAVDCGGIVWAYLFVERDRVTLVDTGIAGSATLIFDALAALRRKAADIKLVVVTHYHKDHIGSLAAIVERTGAECVAHRLDAQVVRGERPEDPPRISDAERPFYEQALVRGGPAPAPARVDRLVDDGDVLDCLDGTTVVHVPGHTPGSIALYAPRRRLLVTGDAVAAVNGSPIVGVFNVDPRQARESAKKLAALDFDIACFGHGEPLLRDASAALRSLASQLR